MNPMVPELKDITETKKEDEKVSFLCKVSPVKTRHAEDKDYYAFRTIIPKKVAEQLNLAKGDYLFIKGAEKAKWYHMVEWREMPEAWDRLTDDMKNEISNSGIETPLETGWGGEDNRNSAPTTWIGDPFNAFYQYNNLSSIPEPSAPSGVAQTAVTNVSSRSRRSR